jgi:hypothetical protein
MTKKTLKICGIVFGVLTGIYLMFLFVISLLPSYTPEKLIENYEERKIEINELRSYFVSILPENIFVAIEYDKDYISGDMRIIINGFVQEFSNTNSPEIDTVLNLIGWSHIELDNLKNKLKQANCISISSNNPVRIGWRRTGLNKYYYRVFENDLCYNLINEFRADCTYVFYEKNIILEYSTGAIGSMCFPKFKRKK